MITDDYKEEVHQDKVWFKCDCSYQDHVVEFQLIDLDAGQEHRHPDSITIELSPLLNPRRSFLQRVWVALRYIFNRPPRYSWHFDSVYIKDGEDLDKLEKMIRRLKVVSRIRKKVAQMRKEGKIK